ncbi:MAG: hypothetical protein RBQ66_01230 [Candidatus Cloacimonadaceae bacterium]|jgi:hypothetical protein|nr:hypothetical protein [Candidatus Cloacimonadota bacterium]MDY0298434.1 hypothetical protein [Candidatus Cloacimonadaceae bacterium]
MKGIVLSILALTIAVGIMADPLSCYDIQYTTDSSGDSPYNGQTVQVQGIVTAINAGTGFWIGDQLGGEWSGLYVYHRNTSNAVELGDMVLLTGTVDEYYNLTEFTNVTSYEIISQNNSIPVTTISTQDMPYGSSSSEKYEGVFVRFNDVKVRSTPDSYGQFKISDTSGIQAMGDDIMYIPPAGTLVVNESWHMMQGVVDYHSAAGYKFSPRNANDMIKVDNAENATISISTCPAATIGDICELDVISSRLKAEWGIRQYKLTFHIDPTVVIYQGFDILGTLSSQNPTETVSADGSTITLEYGAQEALVSDDDVVLIKLKFEPLTYGDIPIYLDEFFYDTYQINSLNNGRILVKIMENIAHLNLSTTASEKNIFDPAMNEILNIEYGTKTGFLARAIIRIYDAQGRLVATPVHQNFSSSTGIVSTTWNGRDSNMNLLKPGLYYCHAEISNRETSKRFSTVQPIVIKSRLK